MLLKTKKNARIIKFQDQYETHTWDPELNEEQRLIFDNYEDAYNEASKFMEFKLNDSK